MENRSQEGFIEKHERLNQLLRPLDMGVGAGVSVLKKLNVYDPLRQGIFEGAKKLVGLNLKKLHKLNVQGLENLPKTGGAILASNHQSWLDAQVLGVGIPRKVCFLAKSEFVDWPLLRHLIELSDSIFIRRGGDEKGLEEAVRRLRNGELICIFPESTIPGEEDIPRSAVEKDTGLLKGKTGAVRLAIKAGVPIVPIGLSGTGKAFPPEAYPRMEIAPFPKPLPVSIKIGKPIHFNGSAGKELSREELREDTKKVMKAISHLVDHSQNYIPMEVPLKDLPRYNKVGVLVLHGFTSHLKTVDGLKPYLDKHHIKSVFPVLRGHGTKFKDLEGVTHRDWYADAEKALLTLSKSVDKVIVVGLSMGGLVALELATKHAQKLAGLVVVAPALKFADPFSVLTPLLSKVVPYWPSPNAFHDKKLSKLSQNYKWFPTSAFASLYEYSQKIEKELPKVKTPILILHSKKDQVIAPKTANIIYENVSSEYRDIKWFYKSGHEMMQDLESKEVFESIMNFISSFTKQAEVKEKGEKKAAAN